MEEALFKATSNSNSNQPTIEELFLIADHTFVHPDLVKILTIIRSRLESSQKEKWKRIQKTLYLVEFLMANGARNFSKYIREKMQPLIKNYEFYELKIEGKSLGEGVRQNVEKILTLCKNEDKLNSERAEGKQRRSSLPGVRKISGSSTDHSVSETIKEEKEPELFHSLVEEVDSLKLYEAKDDDKKSSKEEKLKKNSQFKGVLENSSDESEHENSNQVAQKGKK